MLHREHAREKRHLRKIKVNVGNVPHEAVITKPIARGTVAVVGLGYVGLPLLLRAEEKGYGAVGIDANAEKVSLVARRVSPFKDEIVAKLLAESHAEASTDYAAIGSATTVIICVPTPVDEDRHPDFGPVVAASRGVARYLRKGQLVVLESTVNPGVCETVVLPILEEGSGLQGGRDFSLAHCPERINPGDPKWNVGNIPRVLGGYDRESLERGLALYRSIIDAAVRPMRSLKEAEAVKIVENSFRDINIAFVNELAMSFAKIGIDIVDVIDGAATKPFGFLPHYPGAGVGGHCIAVDPYYLIEYAQRNGFHHDFLALARRINNYMPHFTVKQVVEGLNECALSLMGRKVAVLGRAYKPNIDDERESPAREIVKDLEKHGATVVSYDPYARHEGDPKSLDEALDGATVAIVATAHATFRGTITPEILKQKGVQLLVDGRNMFVRENFEAAGVRYRGIGH